MFGSSTLEVAIGLIFVYLLLSLICSAANEIIATNSKRRAKILERGVRNLLTDPALDRKIQEKFKAREQLLPKDPALPENPAQAKKKSPPMERFELWLRKMREGEGLRQEDDGPTLGSIFYDHPLIKTLYQPRWFLIRERKPAYIPASTFARALLDIMTPVELGEGKSRIDGIRETVVNSLPANSSVRRSLLVFIDEAKSSEPPGEMAALRVNVEEWFNKSMDRVSDWYKRQTQRTIFVMAFALALVLNADTVMIFRVLYHEPSVRATVLSEAQEFAKSEAVMERNAAAPAVTTTPPASADGGMAPAPSQTPLPIELEQARNRDRYQEILSKYQQLGVPLGWDNIPGQIIRKPAAIQSMTDWHGMAPWLLKLIGLFLTAAAITLGAPFWFDILNRFISFRTAVKPPEATPEKDPRLMSLTTPQRQPEERPAATAPKATATPTAPAEATGPAEATAEGGPGEGGPGEGAGESDEASG
jgi:hypothetical protein